MSRKGKRPASKAQQVQRFTIALEIDDYRRLKQLTEGHKPKLSMNYGVSYAVKMLLEKAKDPQFEFRFADPFTKGSNE